MNKAELINRMISKFGYKSYLEIGVEYPENNFNKISIEDKDGVDPAGKCNYAMTSDDFFLQNKKKYDMIFIDGLHTHAQVMKDVVNSLGILNNGGIIVCHDCNPEKEEYQTEENNGLIWTGTCWKAIAELRMTRRDLEVCVVNTDFGCGIIRRGFQELIPFSDKKYMTYEFLCAHRDLLLGLISVNDFINTYQL